MFIRKAPLTLSATASWRSPDLQEVRHRRGGDQELALVDQRLDPLLGALEAPVDREIAAEPRQQEGLRHELVGPLRVEQAVPLARHLILGELALGEDRHIDDSCGSPTASPSQKMSRSCAPNLRQSYFSSRPRFWTSSVPPSEKVQTSTAWRPARFSAISRELACWSPSQFTLTPGKRLANSAGIHCTDGAPGAQIVTSPSGLAFS